MATKVWIDHAYFMLTEIYIEALLVDEALADQIWEAWYKGERGDHVAWLAWWLITIRPLRGRDEFMSSPKVCL